MPGALFSIALVATAAMSAGDVHAMAFGRAGNAVVLGQPLDVTFPLRLDGRETVDPLCVSAEVAVGERSVPTENLRVQVERVNAGSDLQIRVQTTVAIEEPLLSITLAAGCPTRLRRKFVVFADPPPLIVAQGSAVPQPPAPVRPSAPEMAAVPTLIEREATALPPSPPRPAATPKPRAAPAPTPPEPSVAPAVGPTVAQAGASAAAPATDPQAEQNSARLRGNGASVANAPPDRDDRAESDQAWRPWLALALAVVLGLLGWRLWRRSDRRVVAPITEPPPDAADFDPIPDEVPNTTAHAVLSVTRSGEAPMPPPIEAPSIAAAAAPAVELPPTVPAPLDDPIDLEQQAEFFIALGQDDSAIDLLLSHLRRTGGRSPAPYLKLLEIHRRRGEREAYERARLRFNQRFDGVAPEWKEAAAEAVDVMLPLEDRGDTDRPLPLSHVDVPLDDLEPVTERTGVIIRPASRIELDLDLSVAEPAAADTPPARPR